MRILFSMILVLWAVGVGAFEVKPVGESFLKWNVSQGPVTIVLQSQTPSNITLAGAGESLAGAIHAWQQVSGVPITYGGTKSSPSDLENSVVWVKDWQYPDSFAAVTKYSFYLDDPGYMIDADIVLNTRDYDWSTQAQPVGNSVNLKQALTHELGHLLGLSHSSVSAASLYPFLSHEIRVLSLDDRAGARFLYGPPVQDFQNITPVGNAVYPAAMKSQGLPLPVFRWSRGSHQTFIVEFSASRTFQPKISIAAGTNASYQLQENQVPRLLALSPTRRIFWRVRSESSQTTAPRLFTLRQ